MWLVINDKSCVKFKKIFFTEPNSGQILWQLPLFEYQRFFLRWGSSNHFSRSKSWFFPSRIRYLYRKSPIANRHYQSLPKAPELLNIWFLEWWKNLNKSMSMNCCKIISILVLKYSSPTWVINQYALKQIRLWNIFEVWTFHFNPNLFHPFHSSTEKFKWWTCSEI